jgi:hypothetical protein
MSKEELLEYGHQRIKLFCETNNIECPAVTAVPKQEWPFDPCAYYRPKIGIRICLELCQIPAPEKMASNWSWPGCTVDREPIGVLAHELGHHCSWLASTQKRAYGGDYCEQVMKISREAKLTSYCPNPDEWFAEMFRLFVTNHELLRKVRPATHAQLLLRWEPVSSSKWMDELGDDVPNCILFAQFNKMVGR